jgi:hypothetical protein
VRRADRDNVGHWYGRGVGPSVEGTVIIGTGATAVQAAARSEAQLKRPASNMLLDENPCD